MPRAKNATKTPTLCLHFFPMDWFPDLSAVRAFLTDGRSSVFFDALAFYADAREDDVLPHTWRLARDLESLAKIACMPGNAEIKHDEGGRNPLEVLYVVRLLGAALAKMLPKEPAVSLRLFFEVLDSVYCELSDEQDEAERSQAAA